ncbi:MAG TPA: outer membrane beta-barrel domain-containing protein [Desulfuromonadales bacterium]|nr:outer membrane beta-barrel domain-containing protein [Desulfuromonadales bacterium]
MKMKMSIVLAATLAVAATSAHAGVKEGEFSVSPVIGGYTFDGKQHLDTNLVYGARAGYSFTKNLGVEALFDYAYTKSTKNLGKADLYRYGGDLLYHFVPDNKLVPYVAAGFSAVNFHGAHINRKAHGAFDYGVGAKYFVTENLALRADVRHIIYTFDKTTFNNIEYTLGAYIPFGGVVPPVKAVAAPAAAPAPIPEPVPVAKPVPVPVPVPAPVPVVVPPPAPVDSDRDGVIDTLDKCPATPAGVAVDRNGCPLDSDKDGVYNYLDKCPDTPLGTKVDSVGCPPVVAAKLCTPTVVDIEFDTNKTEIKPAFHNELKKLGDFLKEFPTTKGTIEGHTDNVGNKSANVKLSQRRAESVRNYIVKTFGIDQTRIAAKGYGPSKPIADNKTKEGKAKNRRVEANFTCQ